MRLLQILLVLKVFTFDFIGNLAKNDTFLVQRQNEGTFAGITQGLGQFKLGFNN